MSRHDACMTMFDEREFLDVARHLQFVDTREGFQRAAIGRAYSAFLLARTVCRDRGWLSRTGSGADHRAIARALVQLDDKLAEEFTELHRMRTDADYSLTSRDSNQLAEDVQLAIDLAEFICDELHCLT